MFYILITSKIDKIVYKAECGCSDAELENKCDFAVH